MERHNQHGVYFIFKSMEQGQTFRSVLPKFPTNDPDYRILHKQRSRFTHYYFYLRDEVLGPMVLRVASFFPFHTTYYINGHSFMEKELLRQRITFRKNDHAFLAVSNPQALQAAADRLSPEIIRNRLEYWTLVLGPKFSERERKAMKLHRFYSIQQIEFCRNFVFKRNFPIHKIFERSCEMGLWEMTAHKISEVFGRRITKKLKGKLHTTLEQIEHGHHVFRVYFKNAFLRQYEKFCTFLRNELRSNNLADFGLKKGLDHLPAVREHFLAITDRFATYQAQWFNVHVDFPLLQRLALPIQVGTVKFPGIKIQDTRMIRLMEAFLHGGTRLAGWRVTHIHQALLTSFHLPAHHYELQQLRYDLRKMKAHDLVQRDGHHYTYRLTDKGVKVALLFLFFHKRLCGPLANSLFHHRPHSNTLSKVPLEAAYHKADDAIQEIIHLLKAA
jgi:hypothetical protein